MTTQQGISGLVQRLSDRIAAAVPPSEEPAGTRTAVPLARYREGLISLQDLQRELIELGVGGARFASLVQSAILDRDRVVRDAQRDILVQRFVAGQLDQPVFLGQLMALGVSRDERETELAIAMQRREFRDTEDTKAVILRAMSKGAVTPAETAGLLGDLGYREERAAIEVLHELLGRAVNIRIEAEELRPAVGGLVTGTASPTPPLQP